MRRAAVSEASRRHCPERSEGIAEAIAKPVAARPERATATRHCDGQSPKQSTSLRAPFQKGRSNLLLNAWEFLLRLLHSLRSFAMTGASLRSQ